MPSASFVIPANNAEAWIAETLDSALGQTLKDIEVVVVDDGSTDDTAALVQFYQAKDARVRLIRQETRQGRSAARNTGNAAANAPIIMVLDADDLARSTRAAETVRFFELNPDKDVFYSSFDVADAFGRIGGTEEANELDEKTGANAILFRIGHSTMAYRKSVTEAVKYEDGEFSELGIDDWRFQHGLLKAGFKFGYSKKSLAVYRVIPKPRDEKRILEVKQQCLAR